MSNWTCVRRSRRRGFTTDFAQIHPFIDGNGRVARALSSAVFLKAGYLVLVVRDEDPS